MVGAGLRRSESVVSVSVSALSFSLEHTTVSFHALSLLGGLRLAAHWRAAGCALRASSRIFATRTAPSKPVSTLSRGSGYASAGCRSWWWWCMSWVIPIWRSAPLLPSLNVAVFLLVWRSGGLPRFKINRDFCLPSFSPFLLHQLITLPLPFLLLFIPVFFLDDGSHRQAHGRSQGEDRNARQATSGGLEARARWAW